MAMTDKEPAKSCESKTHAAASLRRASAAATDEEDGSSSSVSCLADNSPLDSLFSIDEGVFPPTVFSDGVYEKGLRIFADNVQNVDLDPTTLSDRSSPSVLNPEEVAMWHHRWAAKSCCQQRFPMTAFRLLGTITRNMIVTNDSHRGPFNGIRPSEPSASDIRNDRRPQRLTRASAKVEARLEGHVSSEPGFERRTAEIQKLWDKKLKQGKLQQGWDENGEFCFSSVNDDQFIPIYHLRNWFLSSQATDVPGTPTTRSLYNGLRDIPVDSLSIMNSLLALSSPEGLYKIPLILPYATAILVGESRGSIQSPLKTFDVDVPHPLQKSRKVEIVVRTWKVRIAVYMNRLLSEVLTCQDLHIIMSALDCGSFKLIEPLHLPPTPARPTFKSNPFPAVVVDAMESESSAVDTEEEEKSDGLVDLTMEDSTREETFLSAFSINGFLKLIESTGSDVSTWSQTSTIIAPKMKVELMLHQKHAVAWMLQMESLGGYGINSILWEEREFADGGRYFYSPALGQLRLRPPPKMKGGLLCDQMGLGKTLEVLSLVVATLDELKEDTERALAGQTSGMEGVSENRSHATLVVVPPALVGQWLAEIKNAVGDELTVEFFDCVTKSFVRKLGPENAPDVVVTTYTAFEKRESAQYLTNWSWGRIVLDEMQEVRSSTATVARMCDSVDCSRRWMLSGTPLFEGIGDLRGELNFLRLEPFGASTEDGFFDFSIVAHWESRSLHGLETLKVLGLLMLRRSKSMKIIESGQPLVGLQPLTVEFVPVAQDQSERALYCFMESLIAKELRVLKDRESHTSTTRHLCLRLLHELCTTPLLLCGGVGVQSQLETLNRLMINENRRELSERGTPDRISSAMSCDEAIRFLSQVQERAHVETDFFTSQSMGIGGGASHRSRAVESIECRVREAKERVEKAMEMLASFKAKRARALWHFALEKVTTGQAPIPKASLARLHPDMLRLWKWRSLITQLKDASHLNRNKKLPMKIIRGWRPTTKFRSIIFSKHPNFAWAHPRALCLECVPREVTVAEARKVIVDLIEGHIESGRRDDDLVQVVQYPSDASSWMAILQFADDRAMQFIKKRASSSQGVVLSNKRTIRAVREKVKAAEEKFEQASAQVKVYPSQNSHRAFSEAKKLIDRARLGIRIVTRKQSDESCHILLGDACRKQRSVQPTSCSSLFEGYYGNKSSLDQLIRRQTLELQQGDRNLRYLEASAQNRLNEAVEELSAFESLQALSMGGKEKTTCSICLGHLVGTGVENETRDDSSMVAMTRCGHLFCFECLNAYVGARTADRLNLACPNCRKPFHMGEVIRVDPAKTSEIDKSRSRRQEAKMTVMRASRMLDESNGQLDADMWEKLYLAIDLPEGADVSRHPRHTAIPGDVLAHLRRAVCVPLDSKPGALPLGSIDDCFSSKIRTLLSDIPLDDRSVVFSSSKMTVKHLATIFEEKGIGCRALFTGQHVDHMDTAVNDWKSSEVIADGTELVPCPVLVVQAGAAASGLTLTAACKIFILEPLVRQEEEQQALGRCHRYGQTRAVHCKCYYTPVSVESRLLEWRKGSSNDGFSSQFSDEEKHVVYSVLEGLDADDIAEVRTNMDVDTDHTDFLLGLCHV